MHGQTLSGFKVAILVNNGFDRRRFFDVRDRLAGEGAVTTVVSPTPNCLIRSWHPSNDGLYATVDRHVSDVHPAYDALFLPGTVVDPGSIFIDPRAADFVKSFFDLELPIASLCRDRWLFVHRDEICRGRLKAEPLLVSEIIQSRSTSVASADSCQTLEGFIQKMLAFFEASLTLDLRDVLTCIDPSGKSSIVKYFKPVQRP